MLSVHTEIADKKVKKGSDKREGKQSRKKLKQPEKVSDKSEFELISQLKIWTDEWYTYWNEHIQSAREHLLFLFVDQWDWEVRNRRQTMSIPTLEFNHVAPMIDGILGEQRKNSPQISVLALQENTQQRSVDWRTDLLRQIWYASHADSLVQTCYFQQLTCGWGFLRVEIHYEDDKTFKKCLKLGGDSDYQRAFFDPTAKEKHKQDGDYCGVYQVMSKDDFKRDYPDIENPVSAGQQTFFSWQTRDTITVCDIYYKDYYKVTIAQLSDGQEMDLADAKKMIQEREDSIAEMAAISAQSEYEDFAVIDIPEPLEIVNQRDVMRYKIKHVRYIENELLDTTDWPGKLLPVVFSPGKIAVIDGKENPISFINDLQDPQRLHNYVMSEIATGILNTQRAKAMATPDMTKGFEQPWRQPQKVQGVLHYNPDPRVPGGKPEFIDPPPFSQALLSLQPTTAQEMSAISGRYEESRGQESNAASGPVIRERITAANNVVEVYHDNLLSTVEQLARVMVDLLEPVYEGERTVTIRSQTGEPSLMTINKRTGRFKMPQNSDSMQLEDMIGDAEEEIENNIKLSDYDIEVKAVGSLDYQKQQSMGFWLNLMRSDPRFPALMADLVAEDSNADKATQIAARLKTLLPPDIQAKEAGQQPPPPPPNPAAQLEQQKIQVEMKNLALKEQQMQVDARLKQQQMQMDAMQAQNDRMKLMLDAQQYGLDAQVAREQAQADIHTTRIKAASEIAKGKLGLATANVVHHTHRMKQIDQLNRG